MLHIQKENPTIENTINTMRRDDNDKSDINKKNINLNNNNKSVCIIGAGVAGLAAIKTCLEDGLVPTCFERHSQLGGVWVYDDQLREGQGSAIYESLITNASKAFMCFSDFPFPSSDPPYMPHQKVLQYYQRYAKHFQLEEYIHFNTKVIKVEQIEEEGSEGWRVLTCSKEAEELKIAKGPQKSRIDVFEEHIFDFVMLCSGVFAKPFIPDVPGMSSFTGRISHSHSYRRGSEYGKDDVVVVVGASNSGGDLAAEISRYASQVYLSTRNGSWCINRQGPNSTPIDMIVLTRFIQTWLPESIRALIATKIANSKVDHKKLGLQPSRPIFCNSLMVNDEIAMRILAGKVKVVADIKNFTSLGLQLEDGSKIPKVDAVVFATGYVPSFNYMEKNLIGDGEEDQELFHFVFPPSLGSHPSLAVIGGVSSVGAMGPVVELQCRWTTGVFTKKIQTSLNSCYAI